MIMPTYHCEINGMRALFPDPLWTWPKPPYPRTPHPSGFAELAIVLKGCTRIGIQQGYD